MSTMSTRGRVTIPREIRDRAGIQPGDRIEWSTVGNNPATAHAKVLRSREMVEEGLASGPASPETPQDWAELYRIAGDDDTGSKP